MLSKFFYITGLLVPMVRSASVYTGCYLALSVILMLGGSRLEPPSQLFPVISVCYIALRNRAS